MEILKSGLLLRTPLRMLNHDNEEKLLNDTFIAVVARAGTGKTALIVQLAIDAIFQNNSIIHISLGEPIEKVRTWYQEVFNNLARMHNLKNIDTLWEFIQSNRFIMTFEADNFSVPTLKKRFKDLTREKILNPTVIIIDGLSFNSSIKKNLENLKIFSQEEHLHIWFTVMTHRHELPDEKGVPIQLASFDKMFDDIIQLKPKDEKVYIESLKNNNKINCFLDPATMLIKKY